MRFQDRRIRLQGRSLRLEQSGHEQDHLNLQSSICAFCTAVRMIRTPVRAKQQVARQCSGACSWSSGAHARADHLHDRANHSGRIGVQTFRASVPARSHAREDRPHDRAAIAESVLQIKLSLLILYFSCMTYKMFIR